MYQYIHHLNTKISFKIRFELSSYLAAMLIEYVLFVEL